MYKVHKQERKIVRLVTEIGRLITRIAMSVETDYADADGVQQRVESGITESVNLLYTEGLTLEDRIDNILNIVDDEGFEFDCELARLKLLDISAILEKIYSITGRGTMRPLINFQSARIYPQVHTAVFKRQSTSTYSSGYGQDETLTERMTISQSVPDDMLLEIRAECGLATLPEYVPCAIAKEFAFLVKAIIEYGKLEGRVSNISISPSEILLELKEEGIVRRPFEFLSSKMTAAMDELLCFLDEPNIMGPAKIAVRRITIDAIVSTMNEPLLDVANIDMDKFKETVTTKIKCHFKTQAQFDRAIEAYGEEQLYVLLKQLFGAMEPGVTYDLQAGILRGSQRPFKHGHGLFMQVNTSEFDHLLSKWLIESASPMTAAARILAQINTALATVFSPTVNHSPLYRFSPSLLIDRLKNLLVSYVMTLPLRTRKEIIKVTYVPEGCRLDITLRSESKKRKKTDAK